MGVNRTIGVELVETKPEFIKLSIAGVRMSLPPKEERSRSPVIDEDAEDIGFRRVVPMHIGQPREGEGNIGFIVSRMWFQEATASGTDPHGAQIF